MFAAFDAFLDMPINNNVSLSSPFHHDILNDDTPSEPSSTQSMTRSRHIIKFNQNADSTTPYNRLYYEGIKRRKSLEKKNYMAKLE